MAIVVAKGGIVGRGRNELDKAGKQVAGGGRGRRGGRRERQEGPTGRVLAELVTDGADFGG